ncbi:monocarboxylate transporter 12-like [Drosophila novamexicana]|uniref:monocarboxylate transporter 12-like n=1 Tax=Drosophila novamexicana TaxID=47314 RepID=UPI0011E5CA0B|nr:monocarboxylate transporter 12-like [Drosophila novamexicana]
MFRSETELIHKLLTASEPGPISSSFVNRYGCRPVTIAGAILAAGCIIGSMFAQNVATLIVTIGFGTGLGFGLIYLPAIVSVTQYFEARRSLATGIAVCGSGFGTFVFAPLTELLIKSYGWRGAMLIIGGVVLNCIIFGAMFRPLEAPRPKVTKRTKKSTIMDQNVTPAELEPLKAQVAGAKPTATDQYLQLPPRPDSASGGVGGGGLCRSNSVGHNLKPSLVSAYPRPVPSRAARTLTTFAVQAEQQLEWTAQRAGQPDQWPDGGEEHQQR